MKIILTAIKILLKEKSLKMLLFAGKRGAGFIYYELLESDYAIKLDNDRASLFWKGKLIFQDKADERVFVAGILHKHGFDIKLLESSIVLSFHNLQVMPQNVTDYWILYELFTRGDYDLLNVKNAIVLDIGANTGISMLYFIRERGAKKVYGFEPFPKTLEQAKKNLHLNNLNDSQVVLFPFAVGSKDMELEVDYDENRPGDNSIIEEFREDTETGQKRGMKKETIMVRRFEDCIEKIREQNPKEQFCLKMDCEGCEYEIIDNLIRRDSKIMNTFDEIVIELHRKNNETLKRWIEKDFVITMKKKGNCSLLHGTKKKMQTDSSG